MKKSMAAALVAGALVAGLAAGAVGVAFASPTGVAATTSGIGAWCRRAVSGTGVSAGTGTSGTADSQGVGTVRGMCRGAAVAQQ
jgi:hypothetical protein